MMKRAALVLAFTCVAAPAFADHPAECRVAEHQVENIFPLHRVARAIAAKNLQIFVLGAGSSSLPGPNGAKTSYPGRLEAVLAEKLPGVEVKLVTDVKSKRTAPEMVKTLAALLSANKPALMIWQTGTNDAMQSLDPDQFNAALDRGINAAQSAGADVILVNAQYSPRTESMIPLGTYSEHMRWVALQHEIPLFDRFSIMKVWSDLGTFDLYSATKKLDIAERVHDCIGRLLADLVLEAAKTTAPQSNGAR